MRIVEMASHHPFQDHELSISRHFPEREHSDHQGPSERGGLEVAQGGEQESEVGPFTPILGVAGEMGRTPVLVAVYTPAGTRDFYSW